MVSALGERTQPQLRRRVLTTIVELQFSMGAFVSYRAWLRPIHDEDPEFFTLLAKQQTSRIGCSNRRVPANGTLAQVALAWYLKNPNVSSVITGGSRRS